MKKTHMKPQNICKISLKNMLQECNGRKKESVIASAVQNSNL